MRFFALALITFGFMTFGFIKTAFAQDASPTTTTAALPLNVGNWEVAGGATYTRYVRTNQRYLSITPHAEYFILNRFSVGGTAVYTDDNTLGTTYGIGPSATYYITHMENWALSVDQSVTWLRPFNGDNYVQGATGVAFDFFATRSIAFGPELKGLYFFNGGLNKPDDQVLLAFNFSMFL